MAPMRLFATQLAGKVEVTEGTKETLAAADAVLHRSVNFSPTIEMYKREMLRGTLSRDPDLSGQQSAKISFECELVGSGAVGTAPYWGKFMKGCGFSETVTGGVSVVYAPATNSLSNSMTIAAYMDGVVKRIWGARGNVKLAIDAGKPGLLQFDFEGAAFEMVDAALLSSPTYSTIIPPTFLSASLAFDSWAMVATKMDFDIANTLAKRESINTASGFLSTIITGRDPRGSLDPELATVATYDAYGKWKAPATLGALNIVGGTTAGNIATINCPKVRIVNIKDADRGGLRTLGLDYQATLNSGDDEIAITMT